ncbi:MAG: hypothetical protein HUU19_01475 [Phycisphaerales bacterium]|nr:hypothetical protein [Phycisphaerales bacterium]
MDTPATFRCGDCGAETPGRGASPRRPACSALRDLETAALLAPTPRPPRSHEPSGSPLLWMVRFGVPFSYAASKNRMYVKRRRGHVALRREVVALREQIVLAALGALNGRRIAHNKVWLEIVVQKPDNRGDAVNVVDLVCDAVKRAIQIDDRWFCIRRLDWEIVKADPLLKIGIGQDSDEDCLVCSQCGQIRPLGEFKRRRTGRLAYGRICAACRHAGRGLAESLAGGVAP